MALTHLEQQINSDKVDFLQIYLNFDSAFKKYYEAYLLKQVMKTTLSKLGKLGGGGLFKFKAKQESDNRLSMT